MERARAKRIATAIMGVAFAANYCEPAVAQTANRFIRQPSKAPATPSAPPAAAPQIAPAPSVAAIPVTPGVTPPQSSAATPAITPAPSAAASPATTVPAPAIPATTAVTTPALVTEVTNPATVVQPPTVEGLAIQSVPIKPSTVAEPEATIGTASQTTFEQKPVEAKGEAPLIFPSLLSLTNTPDLEFDLLDSFATVPEMQIEAPATLDQKSTPADVPKLEPLFKSTQQSTQTSPTNSSRPEATRSNQLQWTARTNSSTSRSEHNDLNTNRSSEPTQQPFNAATGRNPTSFNSRSTTSNQLSQTQHDFQSASAAKQQSEVANDLLNRIATRVEAIESRFEKADEPAEQERIRASLVSAQITNDPRFASQSSAQSSVTRIESPQGWQSIGSRLSGHVTKCESLLRRGAFCSAREEAETASMLLFRHIDLHDNLFRCEPAVQSANQALREAEDFLVALKSTADGESLRRLVDAHETPVLKNKNLAGMSPLTAAQHYRQFAEGQLTEAAQGHPWASELLYTVGRTYQAEADSDSRRVDVLRMKAMAYYRASRSTMPSNAVACNQLGYLLLQMDRNEEAREALVAAVTLKADEAFVSNLAEASRRLGDSQTVAWATQTVAAIRRRTPPPSPVPPYVEVSQDDFIAISPREIGPKPQMESNPNNTGSPSAALSAATPNASQLR